jgi:hypothetical protein
MRKMRLASTIYALAGALNLEIYSMSLASRQYVYWLSFDFFLVTDPAQC